MYLLTAWLSTPSQWLTFGTAVLTFLGALWKGRHLLRVMKTGWLQLTGVNTLTEELRYLRGEVSGWRDLQSSVLKELQQIRGELQPNGGSSLHDVVHAIAAAVRARDDREDVPLFWTDGLGRLTHVNRAYVRRSGRSREELVGSGWINFVYPSDRERVLDRWRQAVAEARDFDEVFRVTDTDGQPRTVHGTATRLLQSSGRLLGYYGQLRTDEVTVVSSTSNP